MPILDEKNNIKNTRYLIDCSYSQFFIISECIPNELKPVAPGYYMAKDKYDFAKKLLEDGFIEGTEENLRDYWYGFYMASKDNEKYKNINIVENIDSKIEEYDFDEKEFIELGYNLDFNNKTKKM